MTIEEVTDAYQTELMLSFSEGGNSVKRPVFDLVLLGIGPDGHTCSLFPGHPLLTTPESLVVDAEDGLTQANLGSFGFLKDSPKPPPSRITLMMDVLNHAARVIFVATGAGKKPILTEALRTMGPDAKLPCAMVRPVGGALHWFVDTAALEAEKDVPTSSADYEIVTIPKSGAPKE